MNDAADLVNRICRGLKPAEVKVYVTEDNQQFTEYDDAMNHMFVCELLNVVCCDGVDIDEAKEAHALYLRGEGK